MSKKTLIYALVLLVALSAVAAMAQGRAGKQQQGPPAGAPLACQTALGLSQAQIDQIAGIRNACMNDTADLRADLQARMREIAQLQAQPHPNVALINQKTAEANQIRAQVSERCAGAQAAVQNVLTPEQRAKCAQYGCGTGAGIGGPALGRGPCGAGLGQGAGACIAGQGMGKGPCCAGMAQGKGKGACGAGQGMGRGPCGAGQGAGRQAR